MSYTTIPANLIGSLKANVRQLWLLTKQNFEDHQQRLNSLDSAFALIPTATIVQYPSNTVPAGYLSCNGAAVSRLAYATLFAAIGTSYGAGDLSSTFNIPDLRGRTPLGSGQKSGFSNRIIGGSLGEELHVLTEAELPTHNHTLTDPGHFHYWPDILNLASPGSSAGMLLRTDAGTEQYVAYNATGATVDIVGDDAGHENMQPFLVTNFLIKT
jgi:microcystin-dependent protein